MKITFHGHSCVQVLNDDGSSFIIDPFLTPIGAKTPLSEIKVQHILLTHGHGDHIADAIPLAKQNDATIVAVFELATYMGWQGVNAHGMGLGGSHSFPFGKVKFTQAFHSSSIEIPEEKRFVYAGMPAGIIVETPQATLYHAGDTALFGDMKTIGELHDIDIAFLPIGDNFTMGPKDAVVAARWLNAKMAVPIHYNTFPLIAQDGEAFVSALADVGIRGKVLAPGEDLKL